MTAPEPTRPAEHIDAVALDLDERVARYGAAIWDASRHDEGTISWAGANVVARAVIAVADAEARDRTAPASEPYDAGAVNESYEDGYDQGHADAHADGAAPDRLCKALARAEAAEAEVVTLRARLAEAEALHWKVGGACSHCSQRSDYAVAWPCETAVALAGTTGEGE